MTAEELETIDGALRSYGAVSWRIVNLRSTHHSLHVILDSQDMRCHLVMTGCVHFCGGLEGTGALRCVPDTRNTHALRVRVEADNLLAIGTHASLSARGPATEPNFYAALSILSSILTTSATNRYPPEVMEFVRDLVSALGRSSSDSTEDFMAIIHSLAERFPEYSYVLDSIETLRIRVL